MHCWECKRFCNLDARYIDGETLCPACFIQRCQDHIDEHNRKLSDADLAAKLVSKHMTQCTIHHKGKPR